MKIIVTADLHYGISPGHDKRTLEFIRRLSSLLPAEAIVICGDVAETVHLSVRDMGLNHRRLFGEIKKLPLEKIAFCAGSHDIWTTGSDSGSGDSWEIYSNTLKNVANECGVTYLDAENLYLDNLAVVGTMGHYDYSLATKGLTVNGMAVKNAHYESKTPPGHSSPVWNDANYIQWKYGDKEACQIICQAFEERYKEALERCENILVATHTVPIVEMNGHQEKKNEKSNFLNAFSGTALLGEKIFKYRDASKKIKAFSGHTHFAVGPLVRGGVEFTNIGGDYGSPSCILLDFVAF
ncbi:MAG: metallophosphoesterase [Deltaproteobacteria bacterium]|nr:metallophosphoesterase [Deltaproteobacteria bacterium]